MARPLFFGSLAAALLAGALMALPASGQILRPSDGGGGGGGGAPSSGGTFTGRGGGGGAPAPSTGGTFTGRGGGIVTTPGGGRAYTGRGGGGHGYAGRGYRHGRGYPYRGPAIVGGGWGWGASSYYDYDYPTSEPYYGYERCYVRRVKVKGRWVRRRYCEY
ncbi:hypothetical protein MXD81_42370 [Microbacteriaceae bacterium K1510]|nr:hypothetical protein [Microbacteriaceae bacterium K1510]